MLEALEQGFHRIATDSQTELNMKRTNTRRNGTFADDQRQDTPNPYLVLIFK